MDRKIDVTKLEDVIGVIEELVGGIALDEELLIEVEVKKVERETK